MAGLCALAIASGGVVFDVLSRPLSGSLTFFALSSCRSRASAGKRSNATDACCRGERDVVKGQLF